MICNCGVSIPDQAKFCPECGSKTQVKKGQEVISQIKELLRKYEETRFPDIMTRQQAAKYLQISLPTLENHIKLDGLPYFVAGQTGTDKRFVRELVLEWSKMQNKQTAS